MHYVYLYNNDDAVLGFVNTLQWDEDNEMFFTISSKYTMWLPH